jgi:hypothetical protein
MKKLPVLPILLLLCFLPGLAFSADFGILAEQKIEAENEVFSYLPGFTPWFSWNGGKGLSLYLSGLVSLKYNKFDGDMSDNSGWAEPALTPELLRFALSYRSSQGVSFEAGRIGYSDVLGFAASGLFDGLRLEAPTSLGSFTIGAYYTGLQYKETANIKMTSEDLRNFHKPWDWEYFGDYFASRRALASLRWDMPVGEHSTFSAEALAQFDLNDTDEKLHSQYAGILMSFYPSSTVQINTGALFEAMLNDKGDFNAALGALAQVKMELPTPINDRLGLTVKFTSGLWNDTFTAFTPISSAPQGRVFTEPLGGLALVGLDYNLRLSTSLFAELALRYFMQTFDDPEVKGNLFGGEVWTNFAWQPLNDVRFTLGAGAFFPSLGNFYPDGTDVAWKITAGVVLSF